MAMESSNTKPQPRRQKSTKYIPTLTHEERRNRRMDLAQSVKDGDLVFDVAERFNVHPATVYSACKEFNVHIPKHGVSALKSGAPRIASRSLAILARLMNSTQTYEEIGKEFGVTRQMVGLVAKAARENGIGLHVERGEC